MLLNQNKPITAKDTNASLISLQNRIEVLKKDIASATKEITEAQKDLEALEKLTSPLSNTNNVLKYKGSEIATLKDSQPIHIIGKDITNYVENLPRVGNIHEYRFRGYQCTNTPYAGNNNDFIYTVHNIETQGYITIKTKDVLSNKEFVKSQINGTWTDWKELINSTYFDNAQADTRDPNTVLWKCWCSCYANHTTYMSRLPKNAWCNLFNFSGPSNYFIAQLLVYNDGDVYTRFLWEGSETWSNWVGLVKKGYDVKNINWDTSKITSGVVVTRQGNICNISFNNFHINQNLSALTQLGAIDVGYRPTVYTRFLMLQLHSQAVREFIINDNGTITTGQTDSTGAGYWVGNVTYMCNT